MLDKYKSLRFNVMEVEQGVELLIHFPELKQIPAFGGCSYKDRNKIIRYISLYYDPSSPLQSEYQDIKARKEAAVELAGFERDKKGFWSDDVQFVMDMVDNDHFSIAEMVCEFLRLVNDKTWSLLIVNEAMFWEYTQMLMEDIRGKSTKERLEAANVKTKLREELKAIAADSEVYMKKIFGEEEKVAEMAKEKLKRITPENVGQNGRHK